MEAIFDELFVRVEFESGSIHFSVNPQLPVFEAVWIDTLGDVPEINAAYGQIPLNSPDILTANDELRDLLAVLPGRLHPSEFCYTGEGEVDLVIHDNDPSRHRTLSIDSYGDPPLLKGYPRSMAFFEAVSNSGFCEHGPYWRSDGSLGLTLLPPYAHAAHRLDTYQKLVRLF